MNKNMKIMLAVTGIIFGGIFIYKTISGYMFKRYMATHAAPVIVVSAMKVEYADWQPQIKAASSLRAVQGVNVTPELAGLVNTIYFTPGANVKKGEVLVQLNATSDIAQLHSLQANAELAAITYKRDLAQYNVKAVSKQTVDADAANLKSLQAQVDQQAATVAKKTIKAPFDGRLGINLVNPGQYLNPGDPVVMLQTLDPIYVDFYVPQQSLGRLKVGQQVTVDYDAYPGKKFYGKITTINPAVDVSTRNVQVEATVVNPKGELTPGTFANATVDTGKLVKYLTLPQTAISFNPYGQIVYIIKQTGEDKDKKPILTATQLFVVTGETRGDQVAVLKGLKVGDMVVTSGQLKLKNGSQVTINNSIVPSNSPTPSAPDEH